jgi:hypothetical protein
LGFRGENEPLRINDYPNEYILLQRFKKKDFSIIPDSFFLIKIIKVMSSQNENGNVFNDFGRWFKTAKMRSPDTNLDEARIFVMVIFWGVTLYILGTGLYYHFEIFKVASHSGWFAIAISATIFVVGEFGKYKLFTVFLWGLFSGDFSRSFPKLGAYVFMLVLIVGFYVWSWNISTNAAPTLNSLINKTSNMSSVGGDSSAIKDLELQLATVTDQMQDAASNEKKGFSIKYRGVTTQDGQAIAKKNATLKSKLADQQATLRMELLAARQKMEAYKTSQFDLAANQLSEYGGYGELAQLLLLLINSLILMEMYERNKRKSQTPTASSTEGYSSTVGQPVAVPETSMTVAKNPPIGDKYKYIQGYIFVTSSDRYYNPSEFLVWLRNAYKRNNEKVVKSLRADLITYLNGKHIDDKIVSFIGKYPDIVGTDAVNTVNTNKLAVFNSKTKLYVLHEAGHFVSYCYHSKKGCYPFAPISLTVNEKKDYGYFKSSNYGKDESKEKLTAFILNKLAGLAVEYTMNFEHTEANFFETRVMPYEKLEGSDTKEALDAITVLKDKFNEGLDLEDAFYEAVDLMLELKASVLEVAQVLGDKKVLDTNELTQLAKELNLI